MFYSVLIQAGAYYSLSTEQNVLVCLCFFLDYRFVSEFNFKYCLLKKHIKISISFLDSITKFPLTGGEIYHFTEILVMKYLYNYLEYKRISIYIYFIKFNFAHLV
ncbi:hypothetical protein GDO78_022992 [Eleutherodactylus coqui]|uniref:Uncharacterized protein n=1 Tax=Eleutherodactylus coqui TaxID=57060 RepID=A0A8J6B2G3_ELECQ|nr:hypothetical protein GDO78_022992 [Eleutherodactylus coqui]